MRNIVTTKCPKCKRKLDAIVWDDPSVGIDWEFDLMESAECVCDWDIEATVNEIGAAIYKAWENLPFCREFDPIF
jgi:hypothetical protein